MSRPPPLLDRGLDIPVQPGARARGLRLAILLSAAFWALVFSPIWLRLLAKALS